MLRMLDSTREDPIVDTHAPTWSETHHRYALAAVDVVRVALENQAAKRAGQAIEDRGAAAALALREAYDALTEPAALDRLVDIFGLSDFERDILLLGLGMETDAAFSALCAAAQGDPKRDHPTFHLALATLPDAHWSALAPAGSLRRWRLIEVGPGNALATSPLRLAERVLHYILGVENLDERLAGLLEPLLAPTEIAPSHVGVAQRIATLWGSAQDAAVFPRLQLAGGDRADRRAIATHACSLLGRGLRALPAQWLPTQPEELETLRRIWELEGALSGAALLIEGDELRSGDHAREEAFAWLTDRTLGPVIASDRKRRRGRHHSLVTFEIETPPSREQRALWRAAVGRTDPDDSGRDGQALLGPHRDEPDANLGDQLDQLAAQFHLGAPAIRAAAATALTDPGNDLADALWQACRVQARPHLDDLAQRIEPAASWDDLILPPEQKNILEELASHVRRRHQVYETWGFAAKGKRGLGISALFAGASGTGKTMAAEVLAGRLQLDLYRIDLAAIISKYIGETEKNLSRIFDAAEAGGAILLFDEADALFGKRSEVQDSHDRHANIEVSYLLQRMESYRGLAILTTNMRSALDAAFLRRLRFIVDFPFPSKELRAEIWRRVFPSQAPTENLEPRRLAQLAIAGGNIRNIAMNAAFQAAEAGEPVGMPHLLRATRGEYAKIKKTLNSAELKGWDALDQKGQEP